MGNVEWRDIPGYEGLYQASSDGQIKRLGGTEKAKADRVLRQSRNGGYLQVALSQNGRPVSQLVHRLVCWAFIGEQGDLWVNHKNGVKTDNRIENLEYVTPGQNNLHAYQTGLRRKLCGASNPNARLTENDVETILMLYEHARGEMRGIQGIARSMGLPYSTVRSVIKEGAWQHE